jgi:hypothetical protein
MVGTSSRSSVVLGRKSKIGRERTDEQAAVARFGARL